MADLAVLQARLGEAETALHRLLTGAQVVQVGYADMQTTYARAQVPQLRAYIADLKAQIASAGGPKTGGRRMLLVEF